uniref:Uncharacterized protein n=1 Tax=Mantoniella antarctica TaxID=81844 RepID=A0A7S0T3Z7_9CHLO
MLLPRSCVPSASASRQARPRPGPGVRLEELHARVDARVREDLGEVRRLLTHLVQLCVGEREQEQELLGVGHAPVSVVLGPYFSPHVTHAVRGGKASGGTM